MPSVLMTDATLHRMVRYDAKTEIMNALGDGPLIGRMFGNQILMAPYIHSGLIWSERMGFPLSEVLSVENLYDLYDSNKGFVSQSEAKEGLWQSKLNLVVALGESATEYGLSVGQWVWTLSENTRMLSLSPPKAKKSRVLEFLGIPHNAGWLCKLTYETDLYGVEPDPFRIV